MLSVVLIVALGCKPKQETGNIIGKPDITVKDCKLTPEVLWSLGRIGEVSVSPDKALVIYTV